MRVLRNQQALQFELLALDARIQIREFLFAQTLGGGVGILSQFVRDRRIALERDEAAIAFDQGPQSGEFHRQFAKLVLPSNNARVRQQPADFLESFVKLFQLAPHGIFHGREL
jgi:hypothetical protein